MRQILWFRRDLRINDNAILSYARGEVLPIFIFDTNILGLLPSDDKRVTFIYQSVLSLKKELQDMGLDLAIFYGEPKEIFNRLKDDFSEVLCSIDNDYYAKNRDKQIEEIIHLRRFNDAFLIDPKEHLNRNNLPYKIFTPFYNSLSIIWQSQAIIELKPAKDLRLISFDYQTIPTLEEMGFTKQNLPLFLSHNPQTLLNQFAKKLPNYERDRDFFALDATTNLSVHLRFGLISPKEFFNTLRPYQNSSCVIRQLFFREFYNYLLYHFPNSQFENYQNITVEWSDNQEHFQKWCDGKTGVPIIDAGMRHLNQTGLMHNRLRMVVASFLTKNLLIDWRWGERYFAQKLLDYEASSNIASWQWAGSTGSDSVPYFRVFNPYLQSERFDRDGDFILSILSELEGVPAKLLYRDGAIQKTLLAQYPQQLVPIKTSRLNAIEIFKKAYNANL